MKAIELFAGAGGAALGLKDAGVEALRCVELDQDAAAALAAAGFPAIRGDVRDLAHYGVLSPDLIWSSFPCQAWSTAGKRKGAEDERGGDMWKATVEVIDHTKPTWLIAENVVGLTLHRKECDDGCTGPQKCPAAYLDRVILGDLRARFPWAGTRILNASDYGVPQHRRRLIIVAGPAPIEWPEPTHGKPTTQVDLFGRQLKPWVTVRQALGLDGEPAPTIGGKGNARFSSRVIGGGTNPRNPGESEKRSYRDISDEPCTTIAAVQIGNAGPWVESSVRNKWRKGEHPELLDKPSPVVSATEYKGTNGKESTGWTAQGGPARASDAIWLATGRRRLTVQECATLQGFPPGHPFSGTKTSQYRQVGNAVPPRLAEVVARAVISKQKELEER
jgi:DNA (cytosine-5)-methyltransferase 1